MSDRFVILMDGGFVKKHLQKGLGRAVEAKDLVSLSDQIEADPNLSGKVLFRTFFYDAPPFLEVRTHPISRESIHYAHQDAAKRNERLLQELDLQPHFAVRRGVLLHHGWKLTARATQDLMSASHPLVSEDVLPDFQQKQVDIKLGLDIAWIALKGVSETLVLVTSDSDMVPAMKFARKEGVRVFLHTLGLQGRVRAELRVHADTVIA